MLFAEYQKWRLNNTDLKFDKDNTLIVEYNLGNETISYPTSLEHPIHKVDPNELRSLFTAQLSFATKQVETYEKYWVYTKTEKKLTLEQYELFYFADGLAFVKEYLIANARKSPQAIEADLKSYHEARGQKEEEIDEEVEIEDIDLRRPQTNKKKIIGISVASIRKVTGYSYYTTPSWDLRKREVYLSWQKTFMDSREDVVVLDGSRQMWKSLVVGEMIIEESFIPGKDIMVAAFSQETTNRIRMYIEEMTLKFDDDIFVYRSREKRIVNMITGVSIYFLTLADHATALRWFSLRLVVIDEAQEVHRDIYDLVLRPTLATTGGRTILIGTPCLDKTNVMYTMICDIKLGRDYNNPGQKTGKVITVSLDDNPLVEPKERRYYLDNKDLPKIQREFYNKWWTQGDHLFQLKEIDAWKCPAIDNGVIIVSYDPARKQDRSGFAVLFIRDGKAIIVESGEVPAHMKGMWENQAKFHLSVLEKYKKSGLQVVTCMDEGWVGDWVYTVWKKEGLKVDYRIRYVSGTKEWDFFLVDGQTNVSKSALINNLLDLIESDKICCVRETSSLLMEEIGNITLGETKGGSITMKSSFFDDVTNACMVASYVAVRYRYLDRVSQQASTTKWYVDIYRNKEEEFRQMQGHFNRISGKGGGVANGW